MFKSKKKIKIIYNKKKNSIIKTTLILTRLMTILLKN